MESILGSNGSLSGFFAFLSPLFNLVFTVLSVRVFGIQLWLILLNCLVCFTIIGFITKGSVGIGGVSTIVRGSDARKAAEANKAYRQQRSQYYQEKINYYQRKRGK